MEEKKLIQELRELENSKPLIGGYKERAAIIDANKKEQDAKRQRIKQIQAEAQQKSNFINEYYNRIKEQKGKATEETPKLEEEKSEINNLIRAKEQEKRKLENDFKRKKIEFEKQERHIQWLERQHKIQKNLREREVRNKQREERMKEMEEFKDHPFAREIAQCESFVAYLQRLVPQKSETEEQKNFSTEIEIEGARFIPPKEQRQESWTYSQAKGPKKRKERKRKEPEAVNPLLSLPVELLNFLISQNIRAPTSIEEL